MTLKLISNSDFRAHCVLFSFFILSSNLYSQNNCITQVPTSSVESCGNNIVLSVSNAPGASVTWSPSIGLSTVNGANVTANPTATTTYTVQASGANCTSVSYTITVEVNPASAPSFSVPPAACSGTSFNFSVNNPQSGFTYSWNFPGNQSANGINVNRVLNVASGSGTTNVPVTLTATNPQGCSASVTQSVIVNQPPDATIFDELNTPEFTSCNGGQLSVEISNGSSTIPTNTNYQINLGDGTPVINQSTFNSIISHTYSGVGFFTITSTVTGNNGCIATFQKEAFNGSNPAVGLSNPGGTVGLCTPVNLTYPILNALSNSPGTIYTITVNDGSDPTIFTHPPPSNYQHTFTESSCGASGGAFSNAFFVRITASNPCGVSSSTVEPNVTGQKPSVNYTMSEQIACVNTSVLFSNTSEAGVIVNSSFSCENTNRLNWVITPSSGYTVLSGSLGNNPPTSNPLTWGSNNLNIRFNDPGTYQVKFRMQNTCGSDSITKTICVQPPPEPIFQLSNNEGCVPLDVNTINTSVLPTICSPTNSSWTVLPGSGWNFTNNTNASSSAPSIRFTQAGNYTIRLTTSNTCGQFNANQQVTVKDIPTVSINAIADFCNQALINPGFTLNSGGGTVNEFQWTFSGGSPASSSLQNPGPINYATTGNFTVALSATNECGTATDTEPFEILPPPLPQPINNSSPICVGESLSLSVTPEPSLTYQWIGPNGQTFTGPSWLINSAQLSNSGIYKLIITNQANCSVEVDTLAQVLEAPVVIVTPENPNKCVGADSVLLVASGADTYFWPQLNFSGSSVWVNPSITTTYLVEGTTSGLTCIGPKQVTVTVNDLPQVDAGPPLNFCVQNSPIQLSGLPLGGQWSGSAFVAANGNFTPSDTGSFLIFYQFTDANGCINIDSTVVTVNDPDFIDAGDDVSVCQGVDPFQLVALPTGGLWSGSIYLSPDGIFDPVESGIYQVDYSIGSGTCAITDQIAIEVLALPDININGAAPSICLGDSIEVQLTGGDNYVWNNYSTIQTVNDSTFILSPSQNTIYEIEGFSSITGCSNKLDYNLIVNTLPVLPSFNDTIICTNNTLELIVTDSVGYSFNWYVDDAPFAETAKAIFSFTDADIYSIKVEAINQSGCLNNSIIAIQVEKGPSLLFSLSDSVGCGPLTVSFDNQSVGFETTYFWNFGNGVTSDLFQPPQVEFQKPIIGDTIYTITLIGANFCGIVQLTDSIRVRPTPVAWLGIQSNTDCNPAFPVFFNSSYGSPTSFFWDFGNGETTNSFLPPDSIGFDAFLSEKIYTIKLRVENECGIDSATVDLTVFPGSLEGLFNASPISGCPPLDVTFTNFTLGATVSIWDFGDGSASPGFNAAHTYNQPGTYEVKLFVNNGCNYDTASTTIIVHPQPDLAIDIPNSGCEGAAIQLNNTSQNAAAFIWDFGDGTTSIFSNPTHVFDSAGSYQIKLIGFSTFYACVDTLIGNININSKANSIFTAQPQQGCGPLQVNFINETQNASFFLWDFSTGNTSISAEPSEIFQLPGIYSVSLISINAANCPDTTSLNIEVYPKPIADFLPDSPVICGIPANIQIQNSSTGAGGFLWNWDGGQSQNNNPLISFSNEGLYNVRLIATNTFNCSDTIEKSFEVYPQPELNITIKPTSGCAPHAIEIINFSTFYDNIYWDFGNGYNYTGDILKYIYDLPGTYNILVVANYKDKCFDTLQYNPAITVFPVPVANFSISEESVNLTNAAILLQNNSLNADSYSMNFEPDENFIEGFVSSYIYDVKDAGEYIITLIAANSFGCFDTTFRKITVTEDINIYIPNAFSPNGDFKNETFGPLSDAIPDNYLFEIYDRWGELIFRTTDFSEQWNGTFKNKGSSILKSDLYVYKLYCKYNNGVIKNMIGKVTLVR